MNEQIRKLAEQAGGFVDINKHVGGNNGCMVYTYCGLEKFAELVAKAERERIVKLLDGIDETETESEYGWWETSGGANFGAQILSKIENGS